jgi:hypothetical protein
VERVIHAKFALAFVQSHSFQRFYEHIII